MCEYDYLTQELVKIDPWSSRLQLALLSYYEPIMAMNNFIGCRSTGST